MPSFKYEATDIQGRIRKGSMDADTPKQVRQNLRQQGLTALEIQPLAAQSHPQWGPRIPTAELALATRQLAGLLAASLPLERALAAVVDQTESARVRERFAAARADVLAGTSFSDALKPFPRDFDALYRGLIAAGEATGALASVAEKLAGYLEARQQLNAKVAMAFVYPAIVVLVALLIVGGLLTYVVPQVVSVFESTRQQLPFLTRAMIALSKAVRDWGWLALVLLALGYFTFRVLLRDPGLKRRWHAALLKAPLMGRIFRGIETSRFASTLAILVGSGVPLLKALDSAAETLSNQALIADISEATARVREGTSLARALGVGGRFPAVLVHLIASGEQSGRLSEMLDRAANEQSAELERRTVMLTTLLEPLLVVSMGAVVLLIVLAVLMPIIDLNTMVR